MKSNVILALDKILDKNMLKEIGELIYGIKIGTPLIYDLGLNGVKELLSGLDFNEIIADLKLADIDNTMILIAQRLVNVVDSYIAHSFIGFEGALDKLKDYLDSRNKKLYLVASMSHRGWNDSLYEEFIKGVISKVNPYGLVVGATRPEMIKKVRSDFKDKTIISPGVGVQGAEIGSAICNGADYEIIGRTIYDSLNPLNSTKEVVKKQREKISECKTPKA